MNGVSIQCTKPAWSGAPIVGRAKPVSRDLAALSGLFLIGWATFLNLYATQPLLPQFRNTFHASELLVSLSVSAPVLAVALAGPLFGMWADSIGRKRVIIGAMLGLAIPTALAGTSSTLWELIGWRFLQGLLTPGIVAVAMAYISEETPAASLGSTMSTYVSGGVFGGFSGRFIAGWLAAHAGWRIPMFVLACLTLCGALATWRLLPRSRMFVPRVGWRTGLKSLSAHMRNRRLLATYWVGFNVLFCLVGAFTYVNFYLADSPFHLGSGALASIFGVYLVGGVVTPLAGKIQDRVGAKGVIVSAAAIAALGILLTLIHWVPAIVTGLAIAASGAFACQSAASVQVGKVAQGAKSSASGLYLAFYYLGGCTGAVLPGLFWRHAGWLGCVGLIVGMQAATALIARSLWSEASPR